MTHLSPMSYPSRLAIIIVAYLFVFLLNHYIFKYKWWHNLRHERNLKFWCMSLLYLHMTTWMIYDLITWVNSYYVVGVDIKPPDAKSYITYSFSVKNGLKKFSDALLDITFIAHSTCMFLLLSFWHSIFNLKAYEALNFWNRWEFRFYIVYAVLAVVVYPTVQWCLVDDIILFTVVPQLIYFAEMIFSSILVLIVRYRIRRAARLNNLCNSRNTLVQSLSWLMIALVIVNLLLSSCLTVINIALLIQYGQYPYDILILPAPVGPGLGNNLTLGAKDLLTAIFSASYIPMCVFTCLLLNISKFSVIMAIDLDVRTIATNTSGHKGTLTNNTSITAASDTTHEIDFESSSASNKFSSDGPREILNGSDD